MRSNEEILKEVREQCAKDNSQSPSLDNITKLAMEQAIKECKEEIIEQLEQMSNNYEVYDGYYVIQKSKLDNYIYELEYNK